MQRESLYILILCRVALGNKRVQHRESSRNRISNWNQVFAILWLHDLHEWAIVVFHSTLLDASATVLSARVLIKLLIKRDYCNLAQEQNSRMAGKFSVEKVETLLKSLISCRFAGFQLGV